MDLEIDLHIWQLVYLTFRKIDSRRHACDLLDFLQRQAGSDERWNSFHGCYSLELEIYKPELVTRIENAYFFFKNITTNICIRLFAKKKKIIKLLQLIIMQFKCRQDRNIKLSSSWNNLSNWFVWKINFSQVVFKRLLSGGRWKENFLFKSVIVLYAELLSLSRTASCLYK